MRELRHRLDGHLMHNRDQQALDCETKTVATMIRDDNAAYTVFHSFLSILNNV
jgi:hypothetical protein